MSFRSVNRGSEQARNRTIRFHRKLYTVIDEVTVRRRKYLLLRRLAPAPRHRFLAFDPGAGGELRLILRLPSDDSTAQHARVLKRLSPIGQLPHVIDFERRNAQIIMVLTWVPGIDLADYFTCIRAGRTAPPTPLHAVRLARGLAHGLLSLHQHAQVIHADLKPHNLILTRKPSRLVMIDFGSSWPIERTGFRAAGDGVSRVYAAPEAQLGGVAVDHRADQFSASVLLYRLLTQRIPYADLGGQAGRAEYVAEMRRSLVAPSAVCSAWLPHYMWREVNEVVIRGLSLSADKRFATTNSWVDALDALYDRLRAFDTDRHGYRSTILPRLLNWFSTVWERRDLG